MFESGICKFCKAFVTHAWCGNRNIFHSVFFTCRSKTFIIIKRKIGNDHSLDTTFTCPFTERTNTRRIDQRTIAHDVDCRIRKFLMDFLDESKTVGSFVAAGKHFSTCSLDCRTVSTWITERKLDFKDVCSTFHKRTCNLKGNFICSISGHKVAHQFYFFHFYLPS